jgi:hypothetical protein
MCFVDDIVFVNKLWIDGITWSTMPRSSSMKKKQALLVPLGPLTLTSMLVVPVRVSLISSMTPSRVPHSIRLPPFHWFRLTSGSNLYGMFQVKFAKRNYTTKYVDLIKIYILKIN